jgi:hypothetical protein
VTLTAAARGVGRDGGGLGLDDRRRRRIGGRVARRIRAGPDEQDEQPQQAGADQL